jgi:hypothetical protein
MQTMFDAVIYLLSTIFSIVWWIVGYVFWVVVWLLLPVAIVAFIAMRIAEAVIGKETVRGWLKDRSMRWGGGIWERLRQALVASSALPFRVLFWLVVYTVWHSVISVFWTPRWKPWPRAWDKRWKPTATPTAAAARSRTSRA